VNVGGLRKRSRGAERCGRERADEHAGQGHGDAPCVCGGPWGSVTATIRALGCSALSDR
jgi:hypothetical protein